MKRRHLFLSAVLMAVLLLAGCASPEPGMDLPEPSGDYTMKTIQSSYPADAEEIEVVITNNTFEEASYGLGYSIEHLNGGAWQSVPLEFEVPALAALLSPGGTNMEKIALHQEQYSYVPGEYRVVKQIGDEYIAAEFLLE